MIEHHQTEHSNTHLVQFISSFIHEGLLTHVY